MPQKGPRDGDDAGRAYDRRTILTGAGSLVAGGLIGSSGVASATPGREPGPKKDEIVVGISTSVPDIADAARSAAPSAVDVEHTNEAIRYAVVSFPDEAPEQTREEFIEAITRSEFVEYAEPNATVESLGVPDDPYYGSQYAPQQVGCETAWERTAGTEDVVVSVIDQGIQDDHPALEGAIDRSGADFVGRGDPYPVDSSEQHGTHVGGIVAGRTDDGTGHAGISDCSLIAARALNRSGQGSLTDIVDAVQWSADAGADVINLSLGVDGNYQSMIRACEYATDQGALLVGAAGNNGANSVFYPAAYDTVVGVSALDSDETPASYTNTGSGVDLAAPGTRVLSSVPWNDYGSMSGTSMATPVVSGVAALTLSAYPDLSVSELRAHLEGTAVNLGYRSSVQGHGRVDAGAAVTTVPDGYDGEERGNGNEDDGEEETDGDGGTETDEYLLAFVTDPSASLAGYEFTAAGPVEFTEAPYDSPSGGAIEGGTYTAEDFVEEGDDGTRRAGGVTGGGYGDAFLVDGPVISIDIDQPDVMWVELDGEEMTPEEVIDATGDDGDSGEDGEDDEEADEDGDTCGDETASASANGELSGGWWGESDRYTYSPRTNDPCSATLTLEGPDDADFDLYVTLDGRSPTRWDHDESATGPSASESITVSLSGDESFGLQVHANAGSGEYTLRLEEKGR